MTRSLATSRQMATARITAVERRVVATRRIVDAAITWEEAILALGPIMFLRLNGDVVDSSGAGYDANIAASNVSYVAGGVDGSQMADFNGTSSLIDLGNVFDAALNTADFGNVGSVMIWAKPDDWTESAVRKLFRVAFNSSNDIYIQRTTPRNIRFFHRASSTTAFFDLTFHNPQERSLYTMTWDTVAGELKCYFNKILLATVTGLGTFTGTIATAFIGANSAGANVWNGVIDEVAVFDKVVTASEIAAAFDAANEVAIDALYRIDEDLDYDFIAVGDIAGNGRNDVVSGNSTGGTGPAVYWWEQAVDPSTAWTQRTIDATAGTKLEGAAIGDFDGDGELEVVILDQTGNAIRLYKPTSFGVPTGTWSKTTLTTTGYDNFQDAFAVDVDGDGRPEIVFTAENGANAGIAWLDWDSGDVTVAGNWSLYPMVAHNRAYRMAQERKDWGSGTAADIAFCARDGTGALHGIYTLQKPATVTNVWTRSTVTSEVRDWIKVQNGDFSGDGTGKDLIACDNDTNVVKWWRHSTTWTETEIAAPAGAGVCFNVRVIGDYGGRSMFIIAYENYDVVLYRWEGSSYVGHPIGYSTQGHPLDNDIVLADLLGNGRNQLIIPDSSTSDSKLIWIDIEV